ncbi:MAG: ACT domain-containing protein [Erythrobacter sp.]|nr:ACT domain-containing protein [Erythrobacter sp.]
MWPGFVRDLQAMLAGMDPVCDQRPYRFLALPPEDAGADWIDDPFAVIREEEGVTFVVPSDVEGVGEGHFARITLQVQSSLEGVGLTASVATGLATEGIACNVIAAYHHDHLFVPWDRREEAMEVLQKLSDDVRR